LGKIDEVAYSLDERHGWKEELHRYDLSKILTAVANIEKISNTFNNAPSVIVFKQIFHDEIKWRAEGVIRYQALENRLIQELEILWNSLSWRITKPLRNIKRRLKKLPIEEKVVVHSAEEALNMIELMRNSISWEMTAPLRVVKKTLSGKGN
jgi:hypothetical protein